jgi:hypothetical protein
MRMSVTRQRDPGRLATVGGDYEHMIFILEAFSTIITLVPPLTNIKMRRTRRLEEVYSNHTNGDRTLATPNPAVRKEIRDQIIVKSMVSHTYAAHREYRERENWVVLILCIEIPCDRRACVWR